MARALTLAEEKKCIESFLEDFEDIHLSISWNDKINNKSKGSNKPFPLEVKLLKNDIAWISLPTFSLLYKDNQEFNDFLSSLNKVKKAHTIVFDLRNNSGGNSKFGLDIASTLFGKEEVARYHKIEAMNQPVDWRVSKGNLDHLTNAYSRTGHSWIKNVIDGMKKSMMERKHYFRQEEDANIPEVHYSDVDSYNKDRPIYVITDNQNVSSALRFIDLLKLLNLNLHLIGEDTGFDRSYTEMRSEPIPSGRGVLNFPIKLYVNRVRGDNIPYKPSILCDIHDEVRLHEIIASKTDSFNEK